MSIKFNDFNNGYNNYNLRITKSNAKETEKVAQEEVKDVASDVVFKGLDDDRDLLAQKSQYVYVSQFGNFSLANKEIADETNAILASLGYNYKVSAQQVASVTTGLNETVLPGLKKVEDGAVAAHIQDPNGPFADLFA